MSEPVVVAAALGWGPGLRPVALLRGSVALELSSLFIDFVPSV